MRASVEQVVTFASAPFAGNPAHVVTLAEPVADERLALVCEELQAGVLAVLTARPGAVGIGLGFYTSDGPHPGAGHAAHAAAHVALRDRPAVEFGLADGGVLSARMVEGRVAVTCPIMAHADVALAERLAPMLELSP
jgi:predicted PhzF superfamily epimerase YddE/YHI9